MILGIIDDVEWISEWVIKQRPSKILGLLQFMKFSSMENNVFKLNLPRFIFKDENGDFQMNSSETVTSLIDLDTNLRKHLGIPSNCRLPLIAD